MATQKQAHKILAEKTAKAGLMEDKACRLRDADLFRDHAGAGLP
jgi:hypothetical protein